MHDQAQTRVRLPLAEEFRQARRTGDCQRCWSGRGRPYALRASRPPGQPSEPWHWLMLCGACVVDAERDGRLDVYPGPVLRDVNRAAA